MDRRRNGRRQVKNKERFALRGKYTDRNFQAKESKPTERRKPMCKTARRRESVGLPVSQRQQIFLCRRFRGFGRPHTTVRTNTQLGTITGAGLQVP